MKFQSYGHIEIQTIWEKKPDFNTGMPWQFDNNTRDKGRDITWRHVAQRYRFYLQYGDAKTVRAVLGFEADSQDWGESASVGTGGNNGGNSTSGISGTAYAAGSNHMGVYRTDQVQLEVKHAFVDFVIPNTPISVSAGLQYFELGGRLYQNNDAPGIIATANFAPHTIQALWWRENDNNRFTYNVNDTYALNWKMTKQLFNLGAWGAYKNDLFTGQVGSFSYPATFTGTNQPLVPTSSTNFGVNPAPGSVEGQTMAITLTTPLNKYDDHPWYAGVSGGFRPGNWDFSGQFIYNGGKRKFTGTTISSLTPAVAAANPAVQGDSTYEAYIGEVRAAYRIGPGLVAGLEGYYASGQDYNKSDKITQFTVASVSEGQSNFGNDRSVFMWMNAAQMGYYHERNFTITGFWYGRANVEFNPLTWLRLNLNYLYIGNTNSGSPGTGVSPFNRLATTKLVNTPLGARTDKQENYVGSELNLISTLAIYKNFQWNIGIYGFWPSDMFDRIEAGVKTQSAEFSYGCNTKMVYAF
jgi:hypothetical protein